MLPLLENETWLGDVRSSKAPVGIIVSMVWKCVSNECCDVWLLERGVLSSWTVIAGRLGVLRKLEEDDGS
jgi:hypothetical protein